jgi:hypothetical protein
MKQLKKEIATLKAEILDMQAYLGVLAPVFEREYRKGKWNFEGKGKVTEAK